jgi:hypothetical protein
MVAAAHVKLSFSMGPKSWHEDYYWQSGVNPLSGCIEDTIRLASYRNFFLSDGCRISSAAISELELRAANIIADISLSGERVKAKLTEQLPFQNGLSAGASLPKTSLAWLYEARNMAGGYRRRIFVRGSPSDWWSFDVAKPRSPAEWPALANQTANWKGWLTGTPGFPVQPAGTWMVKGQVKEPDVAPTVKVIDIATVSPTDDRWVITVLDPLLITPTLNQVNIKGVRAFWASGLSAIHTVASTTIVGGNQVLTLTTKKRNDCPIDYIKGATAKRVVYRLYTIDRVRFVRYIVRDTGAPVDTQKGKNRSRTGKRG